MRRLQDLTGPFFAGLLRVEPYAAGDEHIRLHALERHPDDTYAGAFEAVKGWVGGLYDPGRDPRDAIRSAAERLLDAAQDAILFHHHQFGGRPYFPVMARGLPDVEWSGNTLRLGYRAPFAAVAVGEVDFSDQFGP